MDALLHRTNVYKLFIYNNLRPITYKIFAHNHV